MRGIYSLIVLAVAVAFGAGYLVISFEKSGEPALDASTGDWTRVVDRARRELAPVAEAGLDPDALFDDSAALLDPRAVLPRTLDFPASAIRPIYRYAKTCAKAPREPRDGALWKAFKWHQALCEGRSPDEAFLRYGARFHPGGATYAWLLYRRLADSAREAWLEKNAAALHVLELARLPETIVPARYRAFRAMGEGALAAFSSHARVVLSGDTVYLREESETGPSAYVAYRKADWDAILRDGILDAREAAPGAACLFREGNACWIHRTDGLASKLRAPVIAVGAGALLLVGFVLALLVARLRARQKEEERRAFALQTLSHELRTPVSALALTLDGLRERYDSLDEDVRDAFLRMTGDVERLKRLIADSRSLVRHSGSRLLDPKTVEIPSLRDFIEAELMGLEGEPGSVRISADEEPARLDPRWVGLCLRNLVSNALRHGRPPIEVRAIRGADEISFEIRDAGECAFREIETMAEPFVRGPSSQGTGLGLAIVRQVAGELGGKLSFEPSPTRFRLTVGGGP